MGREQCEEDEEQGHRGFRESSSRSTMGADHFCSSGGWLGV